MPAEALKYLGVPRWRAALNMFPSFTSSTSPDQTSVLLFNRRGESIKVIILYWFNTDEVRSIHFNAVLDPFYVFNTVLVLKLLVKQMNKTPV